MSQIGTPAYIVEVFATVMAEGLAGRPGEIQFACAYEVLMACSERDITPLIGTYEFDEDERRFTYRPGPIAYKELLYLAQCLARHGITGDVEPLPVEEGEEPEETEYVSEFNARGHVANAIAHLGLSEKEAWNITMTSLVEALRSKFPPIKKDKDKKATTPPTSAEYDAAMEWADRIEAKRKKRLGIKE